MQCVEDGRDDDYSDCVYYIDATDNSWDVAEEITITEGDYVDLCDGEYGGCDIVVTLIKRGVGSEGDTILRNVDAYADAYQ